MTIHRALLSVSDKTGLVELAAFLESQAVQILSTGGTAAALRAAGIHVTDVSEHTGFPEIMDGRVKTLHPKVHGGILAVRDDESHKQAMRRHDIAPIDLVVINLYPFEQTLARGAGYDECVENIDIGGPGMVRSAAKNHASVTVVVDPADYPELMQQMREKHNKTEPELRRKLAVKAFSCTAAYDAAIARWLPTAPPPVGGRPGGGHKSPEPRAQSPHPNPLSKGEGELFPATLTLTGTLATKLHYGENPHQKAAFYATGAAGTLASARQAQGAALSYNNYNDASAAFELMREFEQPAVVIVKHANPCGVAVGETIVDGFRKALACDPVSAYGGIIATNRPLDAAFCEALGKLFLEVLVAPSADDAALALLAPKKKLKLLLTGELPPATHGMTVKTVSGGFLYQEDDATVTLDELKTVTKTQPTPSQLDDLRFAFTVAKHVKSNTIVLARGGATLGIGAGQMSRIDATRIACWKAQEAGLDTKGAVLASDAFFPFADNIEMAAGAGVAAIIQPGGSMRDSEVIAAADAHGIAMAMAGIRHFRH